jgi:hypothetical protein
MRKKYLKQVFLSILIALNCNLTLAGNVVTVSMSAEFFPVHEYELKAVFLYNLGQFVTWSPNSISNGYFLICVLGKDPFQGSLELAISGKQLHNQPVKLRYLKRVEEGLDCQIIFVSSSEEPFLSSILPVLEKYPILTVSDSNRFLSEGGMIRFMIHEDKIRLQINQANIKKPNLTISSKLLALADVK